MTKSYLFRITAKSVVVCAILLLVVSLVYASIEPIQRHIYPIRYNETVTEMAEKHSIPPSLIYAVIYTESRFDPAAHSSADALGLMQVTESTYHWVCQRTKQDIRSTDVLYDPIENIRVGVTVIHLLQQQFDSTETVLAAYNAGQGKVGEWLKDPAYSHDGKTLYDIPYEETENYVHRVIKTQEKYQTLYNIP